AVALPRTPDVLVAVVAILKAGAVFLPIDLDQPDERIAGIMADARPAVVLTTRSFSERLPAAPGATHVVIDVDEHLTALSGLPETNPADADRSEPLRPGHLAYAIYTSGSTGRPKAVSVEHRSLSNMFHSHHTNIYAREAEAAGDRRLRIALTYAVTFDAFW